MRDNRNDRAEPQFGYNEPQPPRNAPNRDIYPTLDTPPRRRKRSLIPVTITGIVIILFGGAVWMTYTSHKQSTTGEPPVIAAETTPVKVKPEQPGGMSIPYQNTTVYDQLAAGHQKQDPGVEHLLQPPEQPLPKPLPAPEAPMVLPAPDQDVAQNENAPATISSDPAALAPPEPLAPAAPPVVTPPSAALPAPAITSAPPVPPSKPVAMAVLSAPATQAVKPSVAPAAPPAAVGSGFMLQLGAFHDEATANSDWQSTKAAHPAELGALHPTVEKITVSDKTLYRLKAGPIGEAQARQNCAALKAANVVCIVVPQ